MEADIPPPQKAEVPAPPLDTSSQASVEEVETSLESNPINVYPTMATCSSHSDSPMVDLMELQEDANLAANYMLSVKRSLDLKRQWAIWEFKASLHQQEAKEAQPMRKPKLSIQGRTSMPRWDAPRQLWRLSITIGWPSRRPGQLGATNFKSWKLPIWRPLVRTLPRGPLSLQDSTGNM